MVFSKGHLIAYLSPRVYKTLKNGQMIRQARFRCKFHQPKTINQSFHIFYSKSIKVPNLSLLYIYFHNFFFISIFYYFTPSLEKPYPHLNTQSNQDNFFFMRPPSYIRRYASFITPSSMYNRDLLYIY